MATELNGRLALDAIRRSQAALATLVSSTPQDSKSLMVLDGVLHRLQQAADEIHRMLRATRRILLKADPASVAGQFEANDDA